LNRKIIYVQYTNPAAYPPLQHSSRILANRGWQVLFLGTGAFGADSLSFPYHERIRVKKLPFCPPGWRQKFHYFWFTLWVIYRTLRYRPSWIYASDPLSTPVASIISFYPGTRIIYHEHDSPPRKSSDYHSAFMRIVMWTRQLLAKRAYYCIIPNEKRLQQFKSETGDETRALCVWNCPAKEEVISPRHANNTGVLRVTYHGSIVPATLPTTVVKALKLLPDNVILKIIGYETIGHTGYVQKLENIASEIGIRHRVNIIEPKHRKELFEICSTCDIGLSLLPLNSRDMNHRNMVGASNKAFDYLACGLALLVPQLSDWEKLYVEPGYGRSCNPEDPMSIAEELNWFLEHPEETRQMGEKGRKRILEEWNYESQFKQVASLLNGIVQ
jgi:glycosyltransferase involved in cell wall biosynthesis